MVPSIYIRFNFKSKYKYYCWALLLLVLTGCSSNNSLPTSKLQKFLDMAVSDNGVPGVVMAVETPDGVWVGAAGKANLDTGEAMTPETHVRIASITKTFTGTLVMRLVEEGRLSLADTLGGLIPGTGLPNADQITVKMLLNHTSGIPDHEYYEEYEDRMLADPFASWANEDVLSIVRAHEADFIEPGTETSYCNTGYYLLGMIIEAVTGNTVVQETREKLFDPIGMFRTALTPEGTKTEPYARDYCWLDDQLVDTSNWNLSWDWTAGSAVTTAGDMLLWTRGLFGGEIVDMDTLAQMITPDDLTPGLIHFGLGVEVAIPAETDGEIFISHDGGSYGVHAKWLYFPDSKRTIFIALNRMDASDPPPVYAEEIMNCILKSVMVLL